MLTAQEGRLPTDTNASLNTDRTAAQGRGAALCASGVETGTAHGVKTGEIAAVLRR